MPKKVGTVGTKPVTMHEHRLAVFTLVKKEWENRENIGKSGNKKKGETRK
jgi:hypothetical protein